MRIPSFRNPAEGDAVTTPMIDVVFLLLIFFVCTASFQVVESILPSRLLAAGGQPAETPPDIEPPLERVLVRTAIEGGQPAWTVNERACQSLSDVRAVLAAVFEIDTELPVILDVAGDVPLGNAIDVYDLCRVVGFGRVQFAANVE